MAWGYEKCFTIEHDNTLKRRIDCKDCIYYDSSDKSCMKRPLSNMMAFFRSSLLYILFFTSEMWVFVQYRKNIEELSDSKALANLLLIICVAIEIGLLYFFGIVSGELIPFKIKW